MNSAMFASRASAGAVECAEFAFVIQLHRAGNPVRPAIGRIAGNPACPDVDSERRRTAHTGRRAEIRIFPGHAAKPHAMDGIRQTTAEYPTPAPNPPSREALPWRSL